MQKKIYTIRIIRFLLSFLVVLLLNTFLLARPIDSLNRALARSTSNEAKVNLLNDLAWEWKFDNADTARLYLNTAIHLSKTIDFPKGKAQAYNNFGVVETIHGNYPLAISYYQKALDIRKALDDQKGVASLLNNIGNLELEQEAYISALDYFKKSLEIRETLQDTFRMARVHYNISNTYEQMGNYLEAMDHVYAYLEIAEQLDKEDEIATAYNMLGNIKTELGEFEEAYLAYQKALDIRKKTDDGWGLSTVYNNIGNSFDDRGESNLRKELPARALPQFYQAISYHEKALGLRQQLEDREGESASYNNMGLVYKNLGTYYLDINENETANKHFEQALTLFNQSLDFRQKQNDERGMMELYNGIGDVKRRQGKNKEALAFAKKYYAIAEQLNDQKFVQIAYKDMARAYASMGSYQEAYLYRKQYDELRYERLNEARVKQNQRLEIIYGDRKKEQQIRAQQHELALQESALQKADLRQNALLGGGLGLFALLTLLLVAYRIKTNANQQLAEKNTIIETERKRSDDLLLNILPAATATELKQNGRSTAKRYDSVTVLFTDFQSFTQLAEQMEAEELVQELDKCFTRFDEICAKHGVEKIKTIGDAYMCVGGLPMPNETHAFDVLRVALDIQAFIRKYKFERIAAGKPFFEIRMGIHTGPVVAGIVGSRKFAYDIWGHTVNTAARMESSGQVDKINISAVTYQKVKQQYDCVHRGKVHAKNIGDVDMYFVEGLKTTQVLGERRPQA